MAGRVRVGTYNLYLGADLSLLLGKRTEAELAANLVEVERQLRTTVFARRAMAIARLLVGERLDLVGLQEVCTWHADGAPLSDYTDLLLAALRELGEPYDVVAAVPTFTGSGQVPVGGQLVRLDVLGSNVILRRRSSRVQVESTDNGMFGTALSVLAMGIEVAVGRGWCSARCSVQGLPGSAFTFVDTHTEAYDEGSRNTQRDELLATLRPDGERIVVVGDFNALPARVGMPAGFRDAWVAAGNPNDGVGTGTCCQGPDLSNEQSQLRERIDYIWVRGMEVLSSRRIGADPGDRGVAGLWPSDHAGVVAELGVVAAEG